MFRCVSGLGPTGRNNIELGRLVRADGTLVRNGGCDGAVIQPRGATISNYVGIINVFLCRRFTTRDEGVYTCTMRNSSMVHQSVRIGVYMPGRSK